MLLLDTNVISELMRPSPWPRVAAFVRQQETDTLFISSLSEAEIRTRREQAGMPVTIPDAMTAATALAYGASVATRNVGDFIGCGIGVVNPWGDS